MTALEPQHLADLVRRFQRSAGIPAHGRFDHTTRAVLELLARRHPAEESALPQPSDQITPHFTWREFACHDGTAVPLDVRDRTTVLCEQLEVLRSELGCPLQVLSGYRTPGWNAHEGGARHSQHVEGRAADVRASGRSPEEVHQAVLRLIASGRVRDGGVGYYPDNTTRHGWVHYDVGPAGRRWVG